jgi:hypothetical protein
MPAPDRSDNPSVTQNEPNWRLLYAAVLAALAFEVILFYVFTRSFA